MADVAWLAYRRSEANRRLEEALLEFVNARRELSRLRRARKQKIVEIVADLDRVPAPAAAEQTRG